MTAAPVDSRPTLATRIGLAETGARTCALVVGAAALTAIAAQVSVNLPFTPVPVSGETFAVLLVGTALGSRLGTASQALYVLTGLVGLPVYTDATGGWHAATGANGGYLVGFIVAAAVLGALAERRQDREVLTAIPAMLTGTAVIYTFGAVWLAADLSVPLAQAVERGVAPFLIGDTIKLAAAGLLVPAVWRVLDDHA